MALSKISEIRSLSDDDLRKQIDDVKKHLFELRFQKATRQLEKTHQFKHAHHRLAQLMTVERERQIEQKSQEALETNSNESRIEAMGTESQTDKE